MRLLRPIEVQAKQLLWIATQPLVDIFDPAAAAFYERLVADAYEPDLLLNVLPAHGLLYVALPKAASTRIRQTLARVAGRRVLSLKPTRRRKFSGPYGPRSMTKSSFFRLATSPETLRFSFVRNPYARAVSCWADKFRGKPLVAGDHFIDIYLARRSEIAPGLPAGADRTLTFSDFVVFLAAVARSRCDIHFQVQDDILSMPGIKLDLVGKVESFAQDFIRVLDHLDASEAVRREAAAPVNESHHDHWASYYTSELADRIYRAYECDFDRFSYPRAHARAQ
jgi:Sulfotransferase family